MRGPLNAWLLARADAAMDRRLGARKRRLFEGHGSALAELGPGAGANLRYVAPGTVVTAVEPNLAMHPYLVERAERRRIDLRLVGERAEASGLPDAAFELVVATLVL